MSSTLERQVSGGHLPSGQDRWPPGHTSQQVFATSASRASWMRLSKPSLASALYTCALTVPADTYRRAPLSVLDSPSATAAAIWRSRSESTASRLGVLEQVTGSSGADRRQHRVIGAEGGQDDHLR